MKVFIETIVGGIWGFWRGRQAGVCQGLLDAAA